MRRFTLLSKPRAAQQDSAPNGSTDLRHRDHELAHLLIKSFGVLWEDVVVQQCRTAADGICAQALLAEPVEDLWRWIAVR